MRIYKKTRDVEKNWSEENFFPLGRILNYQINRLDVYFQSMELIHPVTPFSFVRSEKQSLMIYQMISFEDMY